MRFQIQFTVKRCGYFKHFDAGFDDCYTIAAKTATEDLIRQRRKDQDEIMNIFHQPHNPIKTIHVVEIDQTTKKLVRKGIKFKLRYMFVKTNGQIVEEYYTHAE